MYTNAKDIINISYNRPTYDPRKSYPRNYNRYIGIKSVTGIENAKEAIEEITSKGYTINKIWNGIGQKVTL